MKIKETYIHIVKETMHHVKDKFIKVEQNKLDLARYS